METKKTNEVLEKWGIDENMSQQDLQKAAEMFAKIQVKNRFLKRTAFFGVTIVVVFLALMLGSVILGTEVTKEFKVKNEILVQKSGNGSALQTSEVYYSVNLNLLSPLSTVKGIKSIKFVDKSDGSIVQFKVVSFYYIYGRNLTLYGDKYVANVLGNGAIEFYPISNSNGARSVDESRVIKKTEDDDDLEIISTYGNGNQNDVTSIYDCAGLSNIQSTGKFALMNNINCNLSEPLLPSGFFGAFNGRGYTITLNMERNGPVALFTSVGSTSKIANLFIAGNLNGKGNCSAFAIEAYVGAKFLSSAVYATITCGNINDDLNDYISLGGFAAVLRNPSNVAGYISFVNSVNQGFFNSISSNENKVGYSGGFYGRIGRNEYLDRRFNFTYSASNFTRYGNNSHANRFGFKYVFVSTTVAPTRIDKGKRDDPYIPEDCYNFDDTNIDYINMCIAWYVIWWFENYDCCSDFNSCPYVNCDLYSQICLYCPHKRNIQNGIQERDVPQKIVPVTQKLCDFDHY